LTFELLTVNTQRLIIGPVLHIIKQFIGFFSLRITLNLRTPSCERCNSKDLSFHLTPCQTPRSKFCWLPTSSRRNSSDYASVRWMLDDNVKQHLMLISGWSGIAVLTTTVYKRKETARWTSYDTSNASLAGLTASGSPLTSCRYKSSLFGASTRDTMLSRAGSDTERQDCRSINWVVLAAIDVARGCLQICRRLAVWL